MDTIRVSLSPDREYSLLVRFQGTAISPAALQQEITVLTKELPSGISVEVSTSELKIRDDSIAGGVDSAASIPDLVVALSGSGRAMADDELQARAVAFFSELMKAVPADAVVSVVVSDRYGVLEGMGPVRIFYGIRRLPHLTLAAFHDYWLRTHGYIGRQLLASFSYYQSHVLIAETALLARCSGLPGSDLDGIVNIHFPDMEAFNDQMSRQEVAEIAIADERKFIDHSRVEFGAMSVLPVAR